MEGDSLYQDRQQLESLLEQYRDVSAQLPTLKAEDATAWIEQFGQWSKDWLGAVWEWFEGLFGSSTRAPLQINWEALSPILFWAAVGLLVICLARGLMVYWRSRDRRLHLGGVQLSGRITSEAEGLSTRLDAAVKQERWDLATRLRWRLFLYHLGLQPNTTPYEFFRHAACQDRYESGHRIPIHEQYRMMFTAADGSRQWFDTYHGELTELEREHRHG